MPDLIGRTLGHYRIVEKIGEGGMGEVYRAHDERLDRDVAVKVLPEEVAQNPDRLARFEREAKAVAKLSHPNILEIFDFGREDGVSFAVTELLTGETLREHLFTTGGPLSSRQVREIGAAVANGLSAAHGDGVVHRDLKPSNIFLCSDGRVKILDFGLASLAQAVDSEGETGSIEAALTHEGRVMGTVGYMAPEQVRGEAADYRADIFALGCVLYEMLTGQRAFKRDTTAEIMTAILREEPRSFDESDVQVTPEVAKMVQRCLEKDPQRRFQSASDLAFALEEISQSAPLPDVSTLPSSTRRRWFSVGAAGLVVIAVAVGFWLIRNQVTNERNDLDPKKVVIAVFENRTGDPSLDALGTLVSEALSEGASGIGDFSVIPSPSSFGQRAFGGESSFGMQALRILAEETGASLVVSGSYYLVGNDIRFQAQLTDAASDAVVYSAPSVTGPRDSSGDVVEALRERVLGAVAWSYRDDFHLTTPPLLGAYVEYQQGRESPENSDKRIFHNRRASELDPDFFLALKEITRVYSNRRQCRLEAQVLGEIEANLARFTPYERQMYRHYRAFQSRNWLHCLKAVRQMNSMAGRGIGYSEGLALLALNRPRSAIGAFSQIPDPTPEQPQRSWGFWWLANAHHMLGEYEQELAVADKYLEYFPTSFILYGRKIAALVALGSLEEIDHVIDEAALVHDELVMDTMVRAAGELRAHGYRDEGRLMAERAVAWWEAQSQSEQDDLRPLFVDALTLAERWPEAKIFADTLLEEFDSLDGEVEEEGSRSAGGVWWGDSCLVVSLGRVGTLAARLGNEDEAQRIADRLRDFDSSCPAGARTYERACIASQLGDRDEAVQLLKKAASQGYWGFWGMETDLNLEPLRNHPEFVELIRPKG